MYSNRFYRERDVELFIEEAIEKKEKYGVQFFYVSAESFFHTKMERFLQFAELFKKVDVPFWIEARPESFTEEKLRILNELSCESISTGIESGNEELRKKILKRHVSNEQIIKGFEALNKFPKIRNCANNIIGFPGETREQIFDTIDLNREVQPQNVMVNIFNPYRGTSLYRMSIEKGYMEKGVLAGDYLKEASDSNVRITGFGLLYRKARL